MSSLRFRLLPILVLAALLPLQRAVAQRDLTPYDVVMMKSVSGAYPSPDGTHLAYTVSVPRGPGEDPGSARSMLFMDGGDHGPRPLVAGDRSVSGVAWHPSGSMLTFLDRREGDGGRQLYGLPMAGGEARRVFSTAYSIGQYRWRPDGRAVAFTATLRTPEGRAAARAAGFRQTVYEEDWDPIGLFLWEHDTGSVRQLEVPGSVHGLEWSPDGTRLVLALAPRPLIDDGYMFKRLHLLDTASGDVRRLVDNPGKLGTFAFSPDGSRIAYVSAADARDPHAGMLFVADAATGAVTSLTPDWEGMVHDLQWLDDGTLRLLISRGVRKIVSDFDLADRTFSDLTTGELDIESVHTAGDAVVAVVSGPAHPGELYVLEGATLARRTHTNPWLDEVALARQEIHALEASDGVSVEGILMYPIDFEEGRRYPLVISVHGGPESHYNNGWLTGYGSWGQLLALRGYFVWYPNYRSSTGRGVAFAKDDHGDLMGREFQDHLDAIDHFVDLGWVDRGRVGIGGGSYGGYTAAWAATRHTDAFAAAVSFVPITDVVGQWLTTDIPYEYHLVHYEETWFFDQWDYLWERSPLTYAARSRTPVLIAGGTSDTRVFPSQPFQLYRAIRQTTDTPVRYVQYPGEGHGNSINVYRYDYLLRSLRWFDHYLRPGDHRSDPPPPPDLDYGEWME